MNIEKNTQEAEYYFHQGTNFHSYDYLGCTVRYENNKYIYTFRTWAPSADGVSLISDIYGWNSPYPMNRITDKGIWECHITSESSLENYAYKFRIKRGDRFFDKGDPYAAYSRGGADGASIIFTDTLTVSPTLKLGTDSLRFS